MDKLSRIQYNNEYIHEGKTQLIDEIVMKKAYIHLEQLDDHVYMLIAGNKEHHWHLRLVAKKSKLEVWMYEED